MAKISFTKVASIKSNTETTINFNGTDITIKNYLNADEKSAFIEYVLQNTFDSDGFASPMRFEIFTLISLVKYYTNINLTDKLLNEPAKLYDLLKLNGIDKFLQENIPAAEYADILRLVNTSKNSIIEMNLSLLGAMKLIVANYDTTKLDLESLMQTLNDPNALSLVKNIATNLG